MIYSDALKQILFLILVVIIPVAGCSQAGNTAVPEPEENPDEETNNTFSWTAAADSSTNIGLIRNYWNKQKHYFNYGNQGNKEFQYWPQAHALDLLVDAYKRTGDEEYVQYMDDWFFGVRKHNEGSFINDFYDDMEWNALAMLRAYKVTDDVKFKNAVLTLWNEIKHGWSEVAGGGIMWTKSDPQGKNAISNSPASILASRLYQMTGNEDYLNWAKKIFHWVKNTLVDPQTGAVWDNIKVQPDGSKVIKKDWVFTYNQGVYLGAALELYKITGNKVYLEDAIKAADYTLEHLVNTADNLLKDEGDGDGGLFKGIFVRYFIQLILEEDLPASTQDRYIRFLVHNAQTLWSEGTNKNYVLYSSYWKTRPALNEEIDLTVQLSGCMLIEAAALLESKNMLDSQ